MSDDGFRMHRFTLRFADAAAEATYAEEHARKSVRTFRILIAAVIGGMVLVYLMVHLLPTGILVRPGATATGRSLVIGILVNAGIYALSYHRVFLRRQQAILLTVFCLFSVWIISVTSRMPADFLATRGWILMLLHTFTVYTIAKLRFPQATVAVWLGAAGYVGYMAGAHLLDGHVLARHAITLALANFWSMLICYQLDVSARREFTAMRLLAREQERSERLLLNILPAPIAERLKASEESIADHADGVTGAVFGHRGIHAAVGEQDAARPGRAAESNLL